ncbi:accessory factor UbiK family protein [Acidithiobacillus sp. CV18-2]|uniref:Ubiquinone biosynthesis accessory factor UbiK n=1 Tax=Igneacidithiobacillus copahuensis TaxID=2724909 RepID=A0AAE2YRI6_9PROT|nr:accessory factor UbiK family protein [Igneacidithiobacillus copahuensis]MBU2754107.1 accessory factor UbiK family protein [Acidithiobacillus sp. CV18-3]MBU2756984.1 accessory factor UbiK family protein [Acidithiobacillus sp. BN09-2]MBU2777846.1 accessory factor UbiK family protein [Acidithiobacillus sp. CV18-2]MBU2795593.1 accessory factor UbiK family protein [Acidithiobacillus sp. VAN18-2]MBU2798821.1 accessory factor UbiK family protein [Acidithiobacillus sp. VAN18-4]UTV81776.1 accessory
MQHRIADDIAAAIGDAVARFGSVKEDLDKQLKTIISNALDRLDLVTREEFEIQQELNTRLAARVAALEARLDKMAGAEQSED